MIATCRHRRLTAWFALVAMLALALVPTLSRALAFAGDDVTWVEVCTPQGMQQVSANGAGADPGQPTVQLDHCAFCGLATDKTAPPTACPAGLQPPPGCAPAPEVQPQAVCARPAWAAAQPRGPPLRG